jgi:glycosyltransferase involved in cell wall biosynthesis
MPVHNAADTVAAAVDSILSQSETDFELVIVDDGSHRKTQEILAAFSAQCPRVQLIRTRHTGIAIALNTGLDVCQGRYIARMDADDWSHPQRLARQRAYLDRHPAIGLVGCCVEFGGCPRERAGYAAYVEWTNALLTPPQVALNRFIESPFAHPSVMFRRELVDSYGGYRNGHFPEDYELWLRWLEAGVRMAKLPEKLLTWHDPPHRLSRTHPRYSYRAFFKCKAEYLAHWLAAHNPHHPEIIVWGAGRETRKRADYLLAHGVQITNYVDIDPRKLGQTIHGRPVISEDELPLPAEAFVVSYVASRGARDDIRTRLRARGWEEGRNFVLAG